MPSGIQVLANTVVLANSQHHCQESLVTESSAAMNAIKVTAILLLVAGVVALALDGFHYTKSQEANPGSLEVSADMSRQVTVPIWSGVGALMLGGALLMMPMNRKKQTGSNKVAILITHPFRETAMSNQQAPKNISRQKPKTPDVAPRKAVTLPTKDEVARQENEGGPPVKHSKTA